MTYLVEAKGPHRKTALYTGRYQCWGPVSIYYSPSPPAGVLAAAGSPGVDWRAGLGLECRGFLKNGNALGTRKCSGHGSPPAGSSQRGVHRPPACLTNAWSPVGSQLPLAGPCTSQTSGTLDRSPAKDGVQSLTLGLPAKHARATSCSQALQDRVLRGNCPTLAQTKTCRHLTPIWWCH